MIGIFDFFIFFAKKTKQKKAAFSSNVLPNSRTHNHLLPLCGGGKKEKRLCSEWEAAYSSGKGANEVQRL